ncbi:class II fructose-bisphosphate aldolase [Bacillus sp. FSL K6-3431]|uniref:class II fructose-bisphosphate aldolase n=1 Tax=Bacillus sp. FSL K6-3431 TaxID=2921500 RepID=UPI0030F8D482
MPLVKMKELLVDAELGDYAVGAFSMANMEMIKAAINVAEELRSPLILQIAEVRLKHSPLHLIGPMMVAAAKKAAIPVAVHFDHGLTEAKIREALELGFSSIMYDGSHYPIEKNIEETNRIAALAAEYDVTLEAEIGQVGGSEDGSADIDILITSVEDAKRFTNETNIDALAIAIGNAHGMYKEKPNIRVDRLKEIHSEVAMPLVLHGGSGLTEVDFRTCIHHGIRKINVATSTFNHVVHAVNKDAPFSDYYSYHERIVEAASESIRNHMRIFKSDGRLRRSFDV